MVNGPDDLELGKGRDGSMDLEKNGIFDEIANGLE